MVITKTSEKRKNSIFLFQKQKKNKERKKPYNASVQGPTCSQFVLVMPQENLLTPRRVDRENSSESQPTRDAYCPPSRRYSSMESKGNRTMKFSEATLNCAWVARY